MKFGLKENTLKEIIKVIEKYPEVEEAILYGSRAKGTQKKASDIDITLKGEKLTLSIKNKIDTELDDLLLPYMFDLSLYHHINNPELIEHINRAGITLHCRKTNTGVKSHTRE
ncbi:MAG: nucleotidyltransferase domain-containing protein [Bacteroidales bacterium]|nr:nucleotidyltransferase domain-containing protein [Bacteroidales bacterium]